MELRTRTETLTFATCAWCDATSQALGDPDQAEMAAKRQGWREVVPGERQTLTLCPSCLQRLASWFAQGCPCL